MDLIQADLSFPSYFLRSRLLRFEPASNLTQVQLIDSFPATRCYSGPLPGNASSPTSSSPFCAETLLLNHFSIAPIFPRSQHVIRPLRSRARPSTIFSGVDLLSFGRLSLSLFVLLCRRGLSFASQGSYHVFIDPPYINCVKYLEITREPSSPFPLSFRRPPRLARERSAPPSCLRRPPVFLVFVCSRSLRRSR